MSHPAKSHVYVQKGLEIGLYKLSVIFFYCMFERKTEFGERAKDAQIFMPPQKKSISLNLGKQLKKYRF